MGCGWLRTLFKVGLGLLSAFIEGWFVIFLNGWPGLRVYLRLAQNFIYGGWLAGLLACRLAGWLACLLACFLNCLFAAFLAWLALAYLRGLLACWLACWLAEWVQTGLGKKYRGEGNQPPTKIVYHHYPP